MLDRAAALPESKALHATSLRDIADAMGVTRPGLCHSISSNDELLTSLLEGVLTGTVAEAEEISA